MPSVVIAPYPCIVLPRFFSSFPLFQPTHALLHSGDIIVQQILVLFLA